MLVGIIDPRGCSSSSHVHARLLLVCLTHHTCRKNRGEANFATVHLLTMRLLADDDLERKYASTATNSLDSSKKEASRRPKKLTMSHNQRETGR